MKYVFMGLAIAGMMVHVSPKINTKSIPRQFGLMIWIVGALVCASWVSK